MEKKSKINSTRPYQTQMRPEMAAQTCPGREQTQSYLWPHLNLDSQTHQTTTTMEHRTDCQTQNQPPIGSRLQTSMLTASFLQIVAFCHRPLPFSANEACAFRCCDTHAPQQTLEVQTKQTCAALDGSSTERKQGTEHQSLVGVRVCGFVCVRLQWMGQPCPVPALHCRDRWLKCQRFLVRLGPTWSIRSYMSCLKIKWNKIIAAWPL